MEGHWGLPTCTGNEGMTTEQRYDIPTAGELNRWGFLHRLAMKPTRRSGLKWGSVVKQQYSSLPRNVKKPFGRDRCR